MPIQLTEKHDLLSSGSFKNTKASASKRLYLVLAACLGSFFLHSHLAHEYNPITFLASLVAPVAPVYVEVFEIQQDIAIPATAYVANTTIFNETFSDDLSFDFEAPEVFNFTGALLTLNFTNNALAPEAPVVAEISVGDSPVWRTSSPASKLNTITSSSTIKNVTEVLSLFAENSTISINVLEGSALNTDIVFTLSLYNDTLVPAATKPVGPISAEAIFSSSGPADLVYPLTNAGVPFKLPGEKFSVALPKLETNVTTAKLSLFASATGDEILYYKNDIGKIGEASSNGPLRYLNIFVNDIYVSSVSPKPTLFHSDQISNNGNTSNLWQPLADTGSFEGLSYEVDLVGVLPFLWAEGAKLDVEVVSPISSANKAPGLPPSLPHPVLPGQNEVTTGSWLISGNLLAWESPLVNTTVGDVLTGEAAQSESGIVIEPPVATPFQPKIKTQIVKTNITSSVVSQLNFTLVNALTVNYTLELNTSTHAILTKNSKEVKKVAGPPGSGLGSTTKKSTLILISGIKNELTVLDGIALLPLLTKEQDLEFPFTFDEDSTETNAMFKAPASNDTIKSEINTDIKTKINGLTVDSYKVKEKLTLDDIVGATTDIKVQIQNAGELPFSREVEAANGVIIKDTSVAALINEIDAEDMEQYLDVTF